MIKYVDTLVTFQEVPDEISLCINISNCPCNCEGCHSSYLANDIGEELTNYKLKHLINNNKGITCVTFMGGDSDTITLNSLAKYVKSEFSKIKVAWYSGRQELSEFIQLKNFDFIKLGPYIKKLGALNSETTNQRFYKVENKYNNSINAYYLEDITYKFNK